MPRTFRVEEMLSRDELDQLEAFAREPARTVDECHEWMQAHGYTLHRSAVGSWKKKFNSTDQFRASNDVARALVDAAKAGGTVAISDAATLQLSQMLFEQLLTIQQGGEVETKELWAASMALKNVVQGKRVVEELKAGVAAALAEAERAARAGGKEASADAVVSKVRAILGIKDISVGEAA